MKYLRQLSRQPLKTITGILLVAIAVATLCVCVGQSIAAKETQQQLNESFLSVALPSADYTKEADDWARQYAQEHPEVVKSIAAPGLISAYVPNLVPDNYINHMYTHSAENNNYRWLSNYSGKQFTSVMFEITLKEIGEPTEYWEYAPGSSETDRPKIQSGIQVPIIGKVENIIGIADGYPDYRGFEITCTMVLPVSTAPEDMELTVGQQYLIYGTNLGDSDWWLRNVIVLNTPKLGGQLIDPFDMSKLTILKPMEDGNHAAKYAGDGFTYYLAFWELELVHSLAITLEDQAAMPDFVWETNSDGTLVAAASNARNCTEVNGENVQLTNEEYYDRYREPTIVPLEGSVQSFLTSGEGTLWAEALHNIEINSHAFPIIGVNNLLNIADFAQGKADVAEGRGFTEEEIEAGSRVCIISETLAEQNSLTVGDTLSLQLYENDPNVPYQINISQGKGCSAPVACYFFENTMDLSQSQDYTIIGLYRQDAQWEDAAYNLYAFTPNTIFVPESAVDLRMEYSYGACFRTFLLHNGSMEAFQKAAADAGYANMFYYNDNGYSEIADTFQSYQEGAKRALVVGICVYAAVMLLFLLLFPCQQKTVLVTMESLGTTRCKQIYHVFMSTAWIIIPGALLGTTAGLLFWDSVKNALLQSGDMLLVINMNILGILAVSGIQMILVLISLLLIAIMITRHKNLMKRK